MGRSYREECCEGGHAVSRRSDRPSGRRTRATSAPSDAPRSPQAPGVIRRWLRPDADARFRLARAAGWAVIALTTAALCWVAFVWHPIGDYLTESDFYGAYAPGARLILSGTIDPARYRVYGPVYEFLLAAVGFVARDLFTAGRVISVAAAAGTLALWLRLLTRRVSPAAGFWCVLLLAANPVFFRYGYSATTDAPSVLLLSASLFALLGMRGARAPLWAGLLAGLATLARYNLVALVPASILCLLLPGVAPGGARRRAILTWLLGCGVVLAPWTVFSLWRGHVPGEELFLNYGFYANSTSARHVQDWTAAARDTASRTTFLELMRRDGPRLLAGWAGNAADHLRHDLGTLIGWPTAVLAAAGAVFGLAGSAWRRHAGLFVAWAFGFLALVPVFYSDRYSLAVLPFYLAAAALGITAAPGPARLRTALGVIAALVALSATGFQIADSVHLQRRVAHDLPREVLATGRVLRTLAPDGGRIMARKGHIGYYSGLDVVDFPRVDSLETLGRHARAAGAEFLYFSWVEAQLRPEFSYLLDTTGTVPGLEVIHVTDRNPSVTYRIGPDFGTRPAWFADDTLLTVHTLRGMVRVQPDSMIWKPRVSLGVYELMHGRPEPALAAANGILRVRPREADGWLIRGEALYLMGRLDDARRNYEKLLSFEPGNVAAAIGLGRVHVAAGHYELAARIWRPLIDAAPAPEMLEEMIRLFDALGDREAAARARTRLARMAAP